MRGRCHGRDLGRPLLAVALVSLCAAAEAGLNPQFTLYRLGNSRFFMDYDNGDSVPNRVVTFGAPGDIGLLADVDGDTLADVIVYRQGGWLIDLRNDGTVDLNHALGGAGDIPVVGDFQGKGKAGIGIFRPSNGFWYLDQDANGTLDHISPFGGGSGDQPVVADYDGDGRADRAIYNAGTWSIDLGFNGTLDSMHYLGGQPNDFAIAGDFDGDWKADNAVYRAGVWFLDYGKDSSIDRTFNYGGPNDRPLFGPVNPASSLFVRSGAVGGNGTQAQPYGTINAALAAAAPGTILRVAAGSYPENILFFNRQNLTLLGAGVDASHLNGGSATAPPLAPTDAVVAFESQNIVLRDLHVKSPDQRGIVNQGSSMTLDRVSTLRNYSHNLLGVGTAMTATLLVESSNLNASRFGNGLRLEGGVVATIRRSTIDRNGLHVTAPRPTATGVGRGVESFGNSQLTLEYSSVSNNYDGGMLIVGSSTATLRYSAVSLNGINGIFFMDTASADVHDNTIDTNGVAGARGPTTGYNGIEIFDNWTGPQMLIHENSILQNTLNGIYLGGSAVQVTVANNYLFNNWVGFTVVNSATATVQGNLFELPISQAAEEGMLAVGPGPSVTVGGNTFRNYLGADSPAIHCGGSVTVVCASGSNAFDNVTVPVAGCPASCVP